MKPHAFPNARNARLCHSRRAWLPALPLLLVALAEPACYRATGFQRSALTAEEIPATGGDRIPGLKSEATAGDFFLGNDFVELAVDGAAFGDRPALAGAVAGGSVVDITAVSFDTSYRDVAMPGDRLERLTPVVNQDPGLPLVFSKITPANEGDYSRIRMQGAVYDPQHRIAGATWDASGRVQGVDVAHTISLGKLDRFFLLETTLTNNSGAPVAISNIGDALVQHGGGFRFVVPAAEDMQGNLLSNWGVEIPGSDFSNPLGTSVKASMVGLMGSEPGAASLDYHVSLGLMPLDGDQLAVACDPQHALTENRPVVPERLVASALPSSGTLAPGASLSFHRRLYVLGGNSQGSAGFYGYAGQATGLFNQIYYDWSTLRTKDVGILEFIAAGTAQRGGSTQAEIRLERNTSGDDAHPNWRLERIEWLEPGENAVSSTSATEAVNPLFGLYLPTGTYRVVIRNRKDRFTLEQASNSLNDNRPDLVTPILVDKSQIFQIASTVYLCPEHDRIVTASGALMANEQTVFFFQSRGNGGTEYHFQPLRLTFAGQGTTADPDVARNRSLGGYFSPYSKQKEIASTNYGAYQFLTGNQAFGGAFTANCPLEMWLPTGSYTAYASRGPQSILDYAPVDSHDGQPDNSHTFVVTAAPLPTGWTSFDLPGPSQATTGGFLPCEKLSSALAEGVQVVGDTEVDRNVDAAGLYNEFHMEFYQSALTSDLQTAIANEPYVLPARTSNLSSYGTSTALFTPYYSGASHGGARVSTGWTLADFMAQSEGAYTVVHRPFGPSGLFTLKGFSPTVPLGTGVNAWWNASGSASQGRTQGSFDALELLRGEGFDGTNPDSWFAEFKQTRLAWFALLNQQTPTAFTKGLGLSSALYSLDTPVGLARTYLKTGTSTLSMPNLDAVQQALKAGAAVASTGPLLDVSANGVGPGGLLAGSAASVTLTVNLYAPDWQPVDELRVVVNGQVVQTVNPATFAAGSDFRQRTGTITVPMPTGKDAWIVVEAGVPLSTTGAYRSGTPWARIQRGMYPIAVTNPIFVDVTGGGYTPPGL